MFIIFKCNQFVVHMRYADFIFIIHLTYMIPQTHRWTMRYVNGTPTKLRCPTPFENKQTTHWYTRFILDYLWRQQMILFPLERRNGNIQFSVVIKWTIGFFRCRYSFFFHCNIDCLYFSLCFIFFAPFHRWISDWMSFFFSLQFLASVVLEWRFYLWFF